MLQLSLFRSAAIYAGANVLQRLLPFLLIPVLTRYLTPADYGIAAMFSVLLAIATPLVGINLYGAIARKYYTRDELDFPAYVFTCLCVSAGAFVVIALIVALCAGGIAQLAAFPARWLWAPVSVAFAQGVIAVMLALLQVGVKPWRYAALQFTGLVLVLSTTLVLVVSEGFDWRGPVLGQVCGALVSAVACVALLTRGGWVRPRFEPEYARHAIGFGGPLVLASLCAVAVDTVDRFVISRHEGIAVVGIYVLGYRVGAVIGLLEDSFNRAFQPWLYEQLTDGGPASLRRVVVVVYGYFAALLVMALGLGAIAPALLVFLVPEQFQGASVHVLWIALGFAFRGMYKLLSGFLAFAERTRHVMWVALVVALLNLGLNFALVPRMGAVGAALSTAAAFFLAATMVWSLVVRFQALPWSLREPTP